MSQMHKEAAVPFYSLGFSKLEWQKNPDSETLLNWEFAAWMEPANTGKWWLKSEGKSGENNTESSFVQFIYSQPVSSFWDMQAGIHAQQQADESNYLMLGMFGLAPFFVHIDSYVLLGSDGDSILQFEADYDWKLTRQWVLLLDSGLTVNGQKNRQANTGSGISVVDAGLRLAYEKQRKLVPYVGVEWERVFGGTADIKENLQQDVSEWRGVLGVNIWY
jgi:copper resistance protein B